MIESIKNANKLFNIGCYEAAKKIYQNLLGESYLPSAGLSTNLWLCNNRIEKRKNELKDNLFLSIIKNEPKFNGVRDEITESIFSIKKNDSLVVSIIMPTWNRDYVIKDAIYSILQQSYNKWELIICDDGSTDNTEFVVSEIDDSRIKYFKLKKSNGAIARNHGINLAKGDVIAFLDSDNIWSPDYLMEVVSAYENQSVNSTYTGYLDCIIDNGEFSSCERKYNDFDFLKLAYRNYIDLNTVTFKASVISSIGVFDPTLPRQQDWDLLIRLFSKYTPVGINKPLVLYRRNKEWDQVTETKKKIDTRSYVLNKNKDIVEKYKKYGIKSIEHKNATKKNSLYKIAIKISAPNVAQAHSWGDFHFAHQLGKALYKYGWAYEVHCQDEWYSKNDADITIVLRGRHRYDCSKNNSKINFLWIISHPDRLASKELDDYDHVFVASDIFANKAKKVTKKTVSVLHQAVDPDVFNVVPGKIDIDNEIIFVGNSRNVYRNFVKWSFEKGIDIGLWGNGWLQFVGKDKINGEYIPNNELAKYYSSCKILLNDHWDTMANNGFISNRIYDASAVGAFIISDDVKGLSNLFGDSIEVARNANELEEKIKFYISNDKERKKKSEKAREITLNNHTFNHRAIEIINKIECYRENSFK